MVFTRRTKRILIGFLFLTGVVALILVASARFAEARKERQRYERERAEMRAPEPKVHEIEISNLVQTRRYAAVLRPWSETDLRAEVSGRVVGVFVEPGDVVAKGQPLFQIDDSLARIAADRAKVAEEEARRLLAEAERLFQSRAISDTQMRALSSSARLAAAALSEANESLSRHTIRAPFDGVINSRSADAGEMVQPGTIVAHIVDLSRLRVEFFASEEDLPAFVPGTPLDLLVPSVPDLAAHPAVSFVSRSADPETRLFLVQAILDNPGLKLPGGLQGTVTADIRRFPNLPAVPAAAVRLSTREALVWKLAPDGSAARVPVVIGPEIDGMYPVLEGLQPGDRVLIK